MKRLFALILVALCLVPVSCKATQSAAEKLDEKRVEIYALVDAIRDIDSNLADELLAILALLEGVGTQVGARDPSD